MFLSRLYYLFQLSWAQIQDFGRDVKLYRNLGMEMLRKMAPVVRKVPVWFQGVLLPHCLPWICLWSFVLVALNLFVLFTLNKFCIFSMRLVAKNISKCFVDAGWNSRNFPEIVIYEELWSPRLLPVEFSHWKRSKVCAFDWETFNLYFVFL